MKYFLLILLLTFCTALNAQKFFEGFIVYKTYSPGDNSIKKSFTVYFKDGKMLLDDGNPPDVGRFTLYDFKQRKAYHFSYEDSAAIFGTILANLFLLKAADSSAADMNILAYSAQRYAGTIKAPLDKTFKSVDVWFTDKLLFDVDESANFVLPPVIQFSNKKISLKIAIALYSEEEGIQSMVVEATEIKEVLLPATKFEIPGYMRVLSQAAYNAEIMKKFKSIDGQLPKNQE